jgi:hypothetical protein
MAIEVLPILSVVGLDEFLKDMIILTPASVAEERRK